MNIISSIPYMWIPVLLIIYSIIIGQSVKKVVKSLEGLNVFLIGFLSTLVYFAPFTYLVSVLNIADYKIIFIIYASVFLIVALVISREWKYLIPNKTTIIYFLIATAVMITYDSINSGNSILDGDWQAYGQMFEHGNKFVGVDLRYYIKTDGNGTFNIQYMILTVYHFFGNWIGLFIGEVTAQHGTINLELQSFIFVIGSAFSIIVLQELLTVVNKKYSLLILIVGSIILSAVNDFKLGGVGSWHINAIMIYCLILYFKDELSWGKLAFILSSVFFWVSSMIIYFIVWAPLMFIKKKKVHWFSLGMIVGTQLFWIFLLQYSKEAKELDVYLSRSSISLITITIMTLLFFAPSWLIKLRDWFIDNANKLLFILLVIHPLYIVTELIVAPPEFDHIYYVAILRIVAAIAMSWFVYTIYQAQDFEWQAAIVVILIFLNPIFMYALSFIEEFNVIGHRLSVFGFNDPKYSFNFAPLTLFVLGIQFIKRDVLEDL